MDEEVLLSPDVHAYWQDNLAELCAPESDSDGQQPAIAPDIPDLVRLHRLVRRERFFTILEFGVGYSSLVLADALAKNKHEDVSRLASISLRNSRLWELHSVDANRIWIARTQARIPPDLQGYVRLYESAVTATTFGGQLCHLYDSVPDVVPDFIYIDGPDPRDVLGEVHGQTFSIPERTPMAADVLLLEPTLLPGTVVLIDGRTNNARFIMGNLRRKWRSHYVDADITILVLEESRLGPVNVVARDVFDSAGT